MQLRGRARPANRNQPSWQRGRPGSMVAKNRPAGGHLEGSSQTGLLGLGDFVQEVSVCPKIPEPVEQEVQRCDGLR